jgi:hypothetical protein
MVCFSVFWNVLGVIRNVLGCFWVIWGAFNETPQGFCVFVMETCSKRPNYLPSGGSVKSKFGRLEQVRANKTQNPWGVSLKAPQITQKQPKTFRITPKTFQNTLKHTMPPQITPKHPKTFQNTPKNPKTTEKNPNHPKTHKNIPNHPKIPQNTLNHPKPFKNTSKTHQITPNHPKTHKTP